MVVRPGERLATDGRIITGRTSLDTSALTGDNLITATALGKAAGISEIHADLRPEDKAEIIRTLTIGPVRKYARLGNPIVILTGFTNWLFDIQANRRSIVSRLDLPGQAYLYMMSIVIVVTVLLLVRRYARHNG